MFRIGRDELVTRSDKVEIDPALIDLYKDLHRHPELGFQEHRTSAIVAERLNALGFEVTTGVGKTGVVGVLKNGAGPTALLRADMDALPVQEDTGLDYASTATAVDEHGETKPVAHACGHDMHMTCLLGAAQILSTDTASWSGTLLIVFQPAEELGAGAQAMVDDGLFDRFPKPDVVLGQHVAPLPAGKIAGHPGLSYAGSDSLRVRVIGRGAHGRCRKHPSTRSSLRPRSYCVCRRSSRARSRARRPRCSRSVPFTREMRPTSFPVRSCCS